MFKISTKAAYAFYNNQDFSLQNTFVAVNDNYTSLYLHNNKILRKDKSNTYFCLCGWDTKTTCERLRACGLPIKHKNKQLYYDDIAIDDYHMYKINQDNTITQL